MLNPNEDSNLCDWSVYDWLVDWEGFGNLGWDELPALDGQQPPQASTDIRVDCDGERDVSGLENWWDFIYEKAWGITGVIGFAQVVFLSQLSEFPKH
jgi:hypothetical protein